jgi:hypothetical protein
LSIIHPLPANHEKYVEPSGKEKKIKLTDIYPDPVMGHDEMIHILTQAGYFVNKSNPDI